MSPSPPIAGALMLQLLSIDLARPRYVPMSPVDSVVRREILSEFYVGLREQKKLIGADSRLGSYRK